MKRFHFSLERVLALRRTQAQVEESKLNRIRTELKRIDTRVDQLNLELREAEHAMRSSGAASSQDLAILSNFRDHVHIQNTRLDRDRREVQKREQEQMGVLTHKRREVKLLEKVRQKKKNAWAADVEREDARQAEEIFLHRWQKIQ